MRRLHISVMEREQFGPLVKAFQHGVRQRNGTRQRPESSSRHNSRRESRGLGTQQQQRQSQEAERKKPQQPGENQPQQHAHVWEDQQRMLFDAEDIARMRVRAVEQIERKEVVAAWLADKGPDASATDALQRKQLKLFYSAQLHSEQQDADVNHTRPGSASLRAAASASRGSIQSTGGGASTPPAERRHFTPPSVAGQRTPPPAPSPVRYAQSQAESSPNRKGSGVLRPHPELTHNQQEHCFSTGCTGNDRLKETSDSCAQWGIPLSPTKFHPPPPAPFTTLLPLPVLKSCAFEWLQSSSPW